MSQQNINARPIAYSDPTGDLAAARVDSERTAREGINPDSATHAADKFLIPPEYALAKVAKNAYTRDENGTREGVLPWLDPRWTRKRRARALRNDEMAELIISIAPLMAREAA